LTQQLNRRALTKAILIPSLIWLGVMVAAFVASLIKGQSPIEIGYIATAGAVPALIGLILSPVIQKEWAQILVLLSWLALAIMACLFVGFMPLAILFLAAPVMAALFKQEKIVEALIISAVFTALLYYASIEGAIPETPLSLEQSLWTKQAGIMGLIALVIGTLFALSQFKSSGLKYDGALAKGTDDNPYETLAGSVMRFSSNGNLVSANREAQAAFGIQEASEPVTLSNLIAYDTVEQNVLSAAAQRAMTGGQSEAIRLGLRRDADRVSIFDGYLFPHKDEGLVFHAIDRTENEEKLEELRRNHAVISQGTDNKTLFFAGVSHELRTPLNAIIGFSDMMRSRLFGPLPSKYAEYADLIHDSGQHMLDLIGDVLDLSKVEAGKYSLQYDVFDASDVIRSSVKMMRPAADAAEVTLDIVIEAEDELIVEADRKAVRQILLNLLSNAVKFSHKGGRVTVLAREHDGYLNMRVTDQGEGISADDLVRVGTPYEQSQSGLTSEERGSGLGLSLVKSLTELHIGIFDIQSNLGEGTEVNISLPLKRAT
jgi:cell cycle sensor histidine kinase DivJ